MYKRKVIDLGKISQKIALVKQLRNYLQDFLVERIEMGLRIENAYCGLRP